LCDGFDATEISRYHKQDKPYLPAWERPHTEETSRRQQKRSKLLWFLLRVPSPLFSPLGLELTIVLAHKGEIEIPAALPCMIRARKNMKGGWLRGEI